MAKKVSASRIDAKKLEKKLAELRPILADAVVGDFSNNLTIPDEEDEFTELFVGVQLMTEVIREQLEELHELNTSLTAKATEHTVALEEAQALTHLGSWQWDVETGAIAWSDEMYRIYGFTPQEREIGFEEFLSLIHPGDRDRISSIIGASFKNAKPFEFEHRIVLPNREQRILHGVGKVITDTKGKPIKMVGTSQDITRRKKIELALQRSDRRFRAVTRATHDLVYDINLKEKNIWFNEALCSEYGYDEAQTDSTLEWWNDRLHPDDATAIEDQIGRLLLGSEQTWQAEYRFRKADNSYALVRNRAFVLRSNNGEPERIIGSLLDITAQRQLEHAKDEFLSLVSHQLRTPLTVTRMFSEMLADGIAGDLTTQQNEYVGRITDASIRMIKLVSDILNISRIELDRIRVEPIPTDVNLLIASHLSELAPIAKEKRVQLVSDQSPECMLVPIDADVFNLILENLLANAIRYTRPGKGRIVVGFTQNSKGWLLTVADNGIGIPAAAQAHIFSRFYRADNAVNFDSEGTGLGLYLIKLICDTIGARAYFKSINNTGTTFFVQLPPSGMDKKSGTVKLE